VDCDVLTVTGCEPGLWSGLVEIRQPGLYQVEVALTDDSARLTLERWPKARQFPRIADSTKRV
jgi:hypothetical protein